MRNLFKPDYSFAIFRKTIRENINNDDLFNIIKNLNKELSIVHVFIYVSVKGVSVEVLKKLISHYGIDINEKIIPPTGITEITSLVGVETFIVDFNTYLALLEIGLKKRDYMIHDSEFSVSLLHYKLRTMCQDKNFSLDFIDECLKNGMIFNAISNENETVNSLTVIIQDLKSEPLSTIKHFFNHPTLQKYKYGKYDFTSSVFSTLLLWVANTDNLHEILNMFDFDKLSTSDVRITSYCHKDATVNVITKLDDINMIRELLKIPLIANSITQKDIIQLLMHIDQRNIIDFIKLYGIDNLPLHLPYHVFLFIAEITDIDLINEFMKSSNLLLFKSYQYTTHLRRNPDESGEDLEKDFVYYLRKSKNPTFLQSAEKFFNLKKTKTILVTYDKLLNLNNKIKEEVDDFIKDGFVVLLDFNGFDTKKEYNCFDHDIEKIMFKSMIPESDNVIYISGDWNMGCDVNNFLHNYVNYIDNNKD